MAKQKRKLEEASGEILIGSPEWHYAWGYLAGHTGDEDREAYNAQLGESWQYLGSYLHEARWWHQFRHRAHPIDGERWVVNVPAREDWRPGAFKPEEWLEEYARGLLHAEVSGVRLRADGPGVALRPHDAQASAAVEN